MASIYTGTNMVAFNLNQARAAAATLGILYHSNETPAALITKVKAK